MLVEATTTPQVVPSVHRWHRIRRYSLHAAAAVVVPNFSKQVYQHQAFATYFAVADTGGQRRSTTSAYAKTCIFALAFYSRHRQRVNKILFLTNSRENKFF